MAKVVNGGITMEVPDSEVAFYLRAGFKKVVEEPGEIPAPEKPEITPDEKAAKKAAKEEAKKATTEAKAPAPTEPGNDPEKAGE